MTNRRILNGWVLAAGLVLALVAPAWAQTIAGDRFTLNLGPCTIRSGAGAPEGRVTGKVCDVYIRTDGTGQAIVYVKDAGTGTAGWNGLTPGIPLDPTPGKVLISGSPVSWSPSPSLTAITGAADLTLNPAGNLITAPAGRGVLPNQNYSIGLGSLQKKYLTLHAAELWVETLVAQQTLATIGGRVVVAPTNILARDVAPGDTSIAVKYPSFALHEPGVELGSKLFLESNGKYEGMQVLDTVTPAAQPDGSYVYAVQRDLDGSGLNQWYAGDAILDTGKATGGVPGSMIDLYATRGVISGTGPAIVGSVRGSPAYNDLRPRFAIGNLNGVGYGHTSDIYGFAAGDPAGPNFFVDPVNGLHLRQGGNPFISLRPDGTVTIRGDGNGVTNINGGNIAADSITGDKIAANSITVADLNATGFSDNLVKNGTFEPNVGKGLDDPSSLAGWSKDESSSTAPLRNSCCGLTGPGTLMLDPGNGTYMSAGYLAMPVHAGETYRVAFKMFAPGSGSQGPAFHVVMEESNTNTAGVRQVKHPGASPVYPDVVGNNQVFLAINETAASGWATKEYIYTVGAGVTWASLALYNFSGSLVGDTYVPIYYDDVEVTRQIGPGFIKANAITADKIAAGAISADKISSGSSSNFLRNSECRTGTSDWFLAGNAGAPAAFGYAYDPAWELLGEPSTCYISYNGVPTPPVGAYVQAVSKTYPAIAGARYEASVYLGMHRIHGGVGIQFLDAAGNGVGFVTAFGNVCESANNGGPNLSNYCRSGVIATAPAGTAAVRMLIHNEFIGGAAEYVFFVRAYLGQGKPNQTELSEWSPAGLTEINGGLITTGAIQANHIAAGAITAGKLAAGAVTAGTIAAGSIGAAEIAVRSLTGDRIAVGAITSNEIATRSIAADRIVGGTITGVEIASYSIGAEKLSVGSLSAISANLGAVTAGTITASTVTGSTISGTTIYAGGSAVVLDGNGITVAEGSSGSAASIKLGANSIYGTGAQVQVDRAFSALGTIWAGSGFVTPSTLQANDGILTYNNVDARTIISRNMDTWGGGLRAVYYNFSCACFGFWTAGALARSNVQAWEPVDPLAILAAPLVSYASGTEKEIGFSVEGLAAVAPEAVGRDAQGRPDYVRTDAALVYLLRALQAEHARIADLERRIRVLESKGGGQ